MRTPLASLLLAVALLAACGDDDPSTTPAPSTTSGGDAPIDAPDGFTASIEPAPWVLQSVSDDGLTVRIAVRVGGCIEFDHTDVQQEAGSVTITALVKVLTPGPTAACTLEIGVEPVDVALDEPLGDRELLGECTAEDPQCQDIQGLTP